MCEVLEIVSRVVLLMGLFFLAWQDYHTQMISVVTAALVAGIGIILRFQIEPVEECILKIVAGILVGVILLLVSFITNESVGRGDGIMFLVSGCYLDWTENLMLFGRTILGVGGFGIICFLIKRLGKEDRIPMVPFMLIAYAISSI